MIQKIKNFFNKPETGEFLFQIKLTEQQLSRLKDPNSEIWGYDQQVKHMLKDLVDEVHKRGYVKVSEVPTEGGVYLITSVKLIK